ncbi:MAG: MBL fold metallo-hydrolase, partial [Rhodospirillaceae bacterium]
MTFGPTEQTAKPAGNSAAAAAQLPAEATVQRIAEGILWVRMPLPFALDHINLWVLEDGDG